MLVWVVSCGEEGEQLPSTKVSAVLTLHCNVFCAGELGCKGYRGLLVLAKISGAGTAVVSLSHYTQRLWGGFIASWLRWMVDVLCVPHVKKKNMVDGYARLERGCCGWYAVYVYPIVVLVVCVCVCVCVYVCAYR